MEESDRRKCVAGIFAATTVIGTLALTAPFVCLPGAKNLPYMATPGLKLKKALNFLKHTKRPGGQFLDLGSGDGEAVYQAIDSGCFNAATGIELNPTLYLLSQFRRLFWRDRARCSFQRRDFWSVDCTAPNAILIFGIQPLMMPLSRKLAVECTPGTKILSYRFKLPLSTTDGDGLLRAKIIYGVDEMRIYECCSSPDSAPRASMQDFTSSKADINL